MFRTFKEIEFGIFKGTKFQQEEEFYIYILSVILQEKKYTCMQRAEIETFWVLLLVNVLKFMSSSQGERNLSQLEEDAC